VGRVAFKKGVTPLGGSHAFALPSCIAPFHLLSPRTGSACVAFVLLQLGSATSWRLPPFSHCSASRIFIRQPGCIPSPMVTQDGDHQFDGGEKQAGLRPLPHPQLQGSSSSLLGRRARRAGAYLRVGWRPASSSGFWGWKPSSSSTEEASSSHAGEGELLLPSQGAAFRPLSGRRWPAAPGVSQHVVRHEGGTRVLGRSHSRFCGEDGSEDLPVRFGAAGARWCGVGGQVNAAAGAEVVAARESFSADEIIGAICAPGLRLFGFNIWFLSPARGHEREPCRSSVCPEVIAAAVLAARSGGRCRCCSGRRRATWSLSSRRLSDVEVVHTRGSGTGVPFVMAP
jgi:hypothetical protein